MKPNRDYEQGFGVLGKAGVRELRFATKLKLWGPVRYHPVNFLHHMVYSKGSEQLHLTIW